MRHLASARRAVRLAVAAAAVVLSTAAPAGADLVTLTNGRTLSVSTVRMGQDFRSASRLWSVMQTMRPRAEWMSAMPQTACPIA